MQSDFLSDIFLFNTKNLECFKVAEGGDYKFIAVANQSAQAGIDKVVALVCLAIPDDDDCHGAVISWSKGESAVTILMQFNEDEDEEEDDYEDEYENNEENDV